MGKPTDGEELDGACWMIGLGGIFRTVFSGVSLGIPLSSIMGLPVDCVAGPRGGPVGRSIIMLMPCFASSAELIDVIFVCS